MKGFILAAGKGSRISSETDGFPKCFLEVSEKRVLDWQIEALRSHGVKDIYIVIGYRIPLFEQEYGSQEDITLVKNPFYESCNVLGSLWFSQQYMDGGFYFMHADTLFDKEILGLLDKKPGKIKFAIEFKETVEEEMKVKIADGKIFEVNKTMDCSKSQGEFTGVAKLEADSIPALIKHMNDIIEVDKDMFAFFEVATQRIIDNKDFDIIPVDIEKYRSVEIDFPEDYIKAKELFI
jgi:choline kinase